jgi:hypothetical protein
MGDSIFLQTITDLCKNVFSSIQPFFCLYIPEGRNFDGGAIEKKGNIVKKNGQIFLIFAKVNAIA